MLFTIFLSFRISGGIVSPRPWFLLWVLVKTVRVILSTELLYYGIFDAGDFEQFYKIYICVFYFFQKNSVTISVFPLSIQCLGQTAIFISFVSNFWFQVQSNLGEHSPKAFPPRKHYSLFKRSRYLCGRLEGERKKTFWIVTAKELSRKT